MAVEPEIEMVQNRPYNTTHLPQIHRTSNRWNSGSTERKQGNVLGCVDGRRVVGPASLGHAAVVISVVLITE